MATLTSTGRFAAGEACANNDVLYGPYATIEAAHEALLNAEQNVIGRTIGIQTGNTIEEYWYQGGIEQTNLIKKGRSHPYISLERLREYLYRVTFNSIPKDDGGRAPVVGGCSAFVKDGKLFRNFDFYYDNAASFIVRTRDFEGMAMMTGLDDVTIDDEMIAQLPYHMVDGRNNDGIMVSVHLLFNDWEYTGAGDKSIPMMRLPYEVLTHVKSMDTIATDLADVLGNLEVTTSMGDYLLQCLVTDGTTTYAIVPPTSDNQSYTLVEATSFPKMTNFLYVARAEVSRHDMDMQNRPTGIERFNAMPCDLEDLRFTKAYENTDRLSEFIGIDGTTKDSTNEELTAIYEEARAEYLVRQRDGKTWQTMHSVVYGRKMERLYIQENWEDNVLFTGDEAVQSDWNETDADKLSFIKNKPTIPTVNNPTVTIKQGDETRGSFSLNQPGGTLINLEGSGIYRDPVSFDADGIPQLTYQHINYITLLPIETRPVYVFYNNDFSIGSQPKDFILAGILGLGHLVITNGEVFVDYKTNGSNVIRTVRPAGGRMFEIEGNTLEDMTVEEFRSIYGSLSVGCEAYVLAGNSTYKLLAENLIMYRNYDDWFLYFLNTDGTIEEICLHVYPITPEIEFRKLCGIYFEDLGYSKFSTTETYVAGDVVIYNRSLYKFTASHTGAWTGTDATATSVEELINEAGVASVYEVPDLDSVPVRTFDNIKDSFYSGKSVIIETTDESERYQITEIIYDFPFYKMSFLGDGILHRLRRAMPGPAEGYAEHDVIPIDQTGGKLPSYNDNELPTLTAADEGTLAFVKNKNYIAVWNGEAWYHEGLPVVPRYLTFTANADNSGVGFCCWSNEGYEVVDMGKNMQYSTDGGVTWNDYEIGIGVENVVLIDLNEGDSVMFKGINDNLAYYLESAGNYINTKCVIEGSVAASGDITSLLNGVGCDVALADSCYYGMFSGCTGLTTAPVLPSTTLADSCYYGMFQGCTGLITAPTLPATTLAESCYFGMFNGCTSLTTAPSLPATTLADSCYCSMFQGCTGLTTAPTLPATTLVERCYDSMFYGCNGLTDIEVHHTSWFPGDAKRNSAKEAWPTTNNWVKDVAANGTFRCPSTLPQDRGKSRIPDDWTIETF